MASENNYSHLMLTPTGSFSEIIQNIRVSNGVSWWLSAVFLHPLIINLRNVGVGTRYFGINNPTSQFKPTKRDCRFDIQCLREAPECERAHPAKRSG